MQASRRRSQSQSRIGLLIRGGSTAFAMGGISLFGALVSGGVALGVFARQTLWVGVIIALMGMILSFFFVARRPKGNAAEGEKAASADSLPAAPADRAAQLTNNTDTSIG